MAQKPTYEELEQTVKELKREISERKETEDALREAKYELEAVFHGVGEGIAIIDRTGKITRINKRILDIGGYNEKEIVGKRLAFLKLLPRHSITKMIRNFAKLISGERTPRFEVDVYTKTGKKLYVELQGSPLRKGGKITGMVGVIRDVTAQKQIQEALKKSEAQKRAILDGSIDRIRLVDTDMRIIWANKTTTEELNIDPDDLVGEFCYKAFAGRNSPCPGCPVIKALKSGNMEHAVLRNAEVKGTEGDTYWDIYAVPIKKESGDILNLIQLLRDVTEQKKLETRFQQSQKMESLGTLAGGIAHNFNNILMVIQGRISLMLVNKNESHPDFQHLKGIEECVQNAAELTKDLLGYARKGRYEPKPTDLNELIKNQNRMFGQTKREIKIHGKYDDGLWSLEADQGQIRQALLNLYVNAWQAMPGGGHLYIQTENVVLDQDYIKTQNFEVAPGKYVKISVTDTGVGIDEEAKPRIFDPFFTTRDTGVSTGLGLASVYGIVKNHGGFINVYSKKGRGTTFNIYLPASKAEVAEKEKPSGEIIRGEETILLVDDEDMILEVEQELLKSLGYKVLTAESGKKAVEVCREHKKNIGLVILDLIMPGMGGDETYEALREINPDVKVLLSSGYSIGGRAQELLDRGCAGFIQKPFNREKVSRIIRDVLGRGD